MQTNESSGKYGTSELTQDDISFLLESLSFTKMKFDSYQFPSYELRRERISQVDSVSKKLREMRRGMKS